MSETLITPAEFIDQNYRAKWRNRECVVWYKNSIVSVIRPPRLGKTGTVSLHHPPDESDYTRIADVGKYELCLRVEPYDLDYFRKQLHEAVDHIPDQWLLSELQEMRGYYD
jgi:hypothetical protein